MASKKRWSVTADKFLTSEQVEKLLKLLLEKRDLAIARQKSTQSIRDYYLVRTLLETGLRVFEFCDLSEGDFQGHKITVRKGKGNKPRTVLLTKATALMLNEWQSVKFKMGLSIEPNSPIFPSRFNRKYTTRGVQKRIKLIFKDIGFPLSLSVHSLRHTYCSHLLASGRVGIATVKENLGHHSIAVTNLYAHAVGDLRDVELFQSSSSEKTDLSELQERPRPKKANSVVGEFLRKTNFK